MKEHARHFHEDPHVLHVGTAPNRSYYIPFADIEEAEEGLSSRVFSLNGTWSFHYFESYEDAVDPEEGVFFDEEEMDTIPVPSCWQNHGYGRHQYTNVNYAIPCDPPYVPEENPCGLYVRHFDLEEGSLSDGEGGRWFLNFEGVDSCLYLWVNGEFAGYSQVSHSTSEFEITELLREGIWVALKLGGPGLVLSLVVGVLIAIFQAVTQIHEQTLGFIMKLTTIILVFLIGGGWMMENLLDYARRVFALMAGG